jgi:hypothetical protein
MLRWLAALFALLLATLPAAAAPPGDACLTPERQAAFSRFQERLADADSVEKARRKAERRLKRTAGVLGKARALAPKDAGLAEGARKLDALEARVAQAESPEQVAAAFDSAAMGSGANAGCDMSTGEVIATVLGFILGILPGIILLVLLC